MKLASLLMSIALTLHAVDDSFTAEVRKQETIQNGVIVNTIQTSDTAQHLSDSIIYNQVSNVNHHDIDNIHKTLTILLTQADSGTMNAVQKHLVLARRTEELGELTKAHSEQITVAQALTDLVDHTNIDNPVSTMQSAVDKQKRINEKTQQLEDQMVGKEKQDLTNQEKNTLEDLAKQQSDVNKLLDKIPNDMKQDIKNIADDIGENKLATAIQKQDDVLKKLQAMNNDMQAKNKQQLKTENVVNNTPKESASQTPDTSELKQEPLSTVMLTKWDVALLPKEHEILQHSISDAFPKKYEIPLIKYFSTLAQQ